MHPASMECALAAIDYRPVFDKYIRHKEIEARREVDRRACVTRVERVLAIGANKRTNSDAVADSVLETLDNLGVVRTPGQKRFHREFFCACLPHIYGSDEFERDRERILKRFDFKEIRYEVLVVCPRRWGKTYGVSMFMAALMWCVPDMWISIFSTGQRASTSMLELIGKWIANLSGDGVNRILAKNHEKLYLRGDSNSDRRRCYSYPSSVQLVGALAKTPPPGIGRFIVLYNEAVKKSFTRGKVRRSLDAQAAVELWRYERFQMLVTEHEFYYPHKRLSSGDAYDAVCAMASSDKLEEIPKILYGDPIVRFFGWRDGDLIQIDMREDDNPAMPVRPKYRVVVATKGSDVGKGCVPAALVPEL